MPCFRTAFGNAVVQKVKCNCPTETLEAYEIGESINNPWSQAGDLPVKSTVYLERGQFGQAIDALED